MRSFLPAFLLSIPLFAASGPSLLPLETGNTWTYRASATGETRTITVGLPLSMGDGRIFYPVRGYAQRPLWMREAQDGSLLYLDEETGEDRILTSFERNGLWAEAPLRACSQESRVTGERRGRALVVEYRSFGCADAGLVEEQYEENIGMTVRTEQTIAGPRVFLLESARVGRMAIEPYGTGRFQVEAHGMGERLRITLRLSTGNAAPVTLRFPTGQRYEILIRDREGKILWRWSDGRFFTQAAEEAIVSGQLVIEETVALADIFGPVLPPGDYFVEGFVLGGAYAATTSFSILQFF